ncbi:response regulator transcription factor [Nesterenkonia sandarakina]|uniref:Response regulator receiver domain-containing protein n=1 Tax=Nesterenkonia sandarakina TaxID=272918 RepID=A0A2T0YQ55_9MICC|nr:response regulator transcription factor [Nesterenkonia sandarakina]PRZ17498.1 response regulator receiver domain-containing protein [Nesterenkonia sandarakina]
MQDIPRALIIEDDDDIRRLLEMVLTQAGFAVDAVPNGEEGVARAAASPYALLSVDVGLPDIDGLEVVRRVRPSFTGRIVMVSARSAESDQSSGHAAGADLYITKPFRPRELKQKFLDLVAADAS